MSRRYQLRLIFMLANSRCVTPWVKESPVALASTPMVASSAAEI
jgi:hypothetical protein